jgi:hypothetical protein
MSATSDFPKHTAQSVFNAGLVLQSKPKIEENEYGMLQGTLQFLCANKHWPRIKPKRGTPLDQFRCGDRESAAVLKAYNFLGAQTNGFVRSGSSPGIGILEVVCQGAVFDVLDGVYPVYNPGQVPSGRDIISPIARINGGSAIFQFSNNRWERTLFMGSGRAPIVVPIGVDQITINDLPTNGAPVNILERIYSPNELRPTLNGYSNTTEESYRFATGPAQPALDEPEVELDGEPFGDITTPFATVDSTAQTITVPISRTSDNENGINGDVSIVVDYHSIDLHYEYMARDRSPRPRFLQSAYETIGNNWLVKLPNDYSGGGSQNAQLIIDKATVIVNGNVTADQDSALALWPANVALFGSGARFSQMPAGQFWHVTETAQIQFVANQLAAQSGALLGNPG